MHALRSIPLALMLGACASAPPAPSADPFVVMSWNVRYGTAADGADRWAERRDGLVTAIVAAAPAIVGVQEALAPQLEFLAARLPGHMRLGQGREGGDRGEHCAVFVEAAKFEILEHGDFWLSPTPELVASTGWDAALPRICTWVALRERASGREFSVWNTHFDHRGAVARERSAELIAQRLAQRPGPHLLLGDCNCGERSAPIAALRQAGLRDTFRDVHPNATEVGTFHAFRGGTGGDKIDYVLADAGFTTVAAAILSQPMASGRWPSDHHGVVATVAFRRP
jgi:endonuclease/exonuclease/phosphatase family metal-dependent hydrolase